MRTCAYVCDARADAITHCQNIDIDTTTSARENRERAMEDDDESDDGQGPGFEAVVHRV